eukprot:1058945-Prymnesium_polylepis.1
MIRTLEKQARQAEAREELEELEARRREAREAARTAQQLAASQAIKEMWVTVPPNAGPGMTLIVKSPFGGTVRVVVPAGVGPGQKLKFQIREPVPSVPTAVALVSASLSVEGGAGKLLLVDGSAPPTAAEAAAATAETATASGLRVRLRLV